MKQRLSAAFLALMLTASLAACGQKSPEVSVAQTGETVTESKDIFTLEQHSFTARLQQDPAAADYIPNMGKGKQLTAAEDGYYFTEGKNGHFLRYLDAATGESITLCRKTDCMHEKEPGDTDDSNARINACEAYLLRCDYLNYDKGTETLYLIADKWDDDTMTYGSELLAYAPDGSFLKSLLRFDNNPAYAAMHRGVFYYNEIVDNEDGTDTVRLCAYSLKSGAITVLDTMDKVEMGGYQLFDARGDILLWHRFVYSAGGYALSLMVTDLASGLITNVSCTQPQTSINGCWFYDGSEGEGLIFTLYSGSGDEELEKTLWFMTADCENRKPLMQLRYPCWVEAVYDGCVLESNALYWDSTLDKEDWVYLSYVLYQDGEQVCEFDLKDVDGKDYSDWMMKGVYVTEDSLLFQPYADGLVLIELPLEELTAGHAEPRVLYSSD